MDYVDVVVVGGGIVGLWTAYEILKKEPGINLVLCEKETFLGEHSTGRNSEVLHSGIYYEKNSLKHQSCLRGNDLWRNFVQEHDVGFLNCGKFVVGFENEVERLQALYQRAHDNSVPGVRWMTSEEKLGIQSHVRFAEGFYCPTSGVLSVSDALRVLAQLIEDLGGIILKKTQVHFQSMSEDGFKISIGNDAFGATTLVNAMGHSAVDFRSSLGLKNFINYWVKGNYLSLKKSLPLNSLVYPLPPSNGLGLGIHLTLDVAGRQKFGPNTENVSQLDYNVADAALEQMFPSIQELFPSVQKTDLALGYAGIRSKIMSVDRVLVKDFVLQGPEEHGIPGYIEFLGIESPGVTSAPALAKAAVEKIFS